ncbi:hypothetical protein [Nocardia sp. NBC_00416]|uniref:hypothetical protein n=1 Tax=Nocardia sp. NBC_00416 TaxID=2975991 RepID=UPI002E23145E
MTTSSGRGFRGLLAVGASAFVLAAGSGCGVVFGERIEVGRDDAAVDGAFQRVLDSRQPARLGDVMADADLPFDSWDRMYRFSSLKDGDELNAALGTDVYWSGLPGGSDSSVQIFLNEGSVVHAFVDNVPSFGVSRDHYATPDSMVTPVQREQGNPTGPGTETYWGLDIDEAG